jgi:protein-S-isoprenylcysteine O-methyltransferase Ste14
MIRPDASELLVRAIALYLPMLAVVALLLHRRPTRARLAAALLAFAWNVPALLALNLVAIRFGWWSFSSGPTDVAGVPAELWLGWALLWGAVPVLVTTRRVALSGAALLALDLVVMPMGEPVVVLDNSWLIGELVALGACLAPGLLLGRWTADHARVGRRAVLQVIAFAGLLLFVLPSLVFTMTGEGWAPLIERPRWQLLGAAFLMAPIAAMALQAVHEFAVHGGTPLPLDPPPSLVTTGPYAYVANPMQLGSTVLLAALGLLLASPAVVAVAAMAAVFSAGLAAWIEERELAGRFGGDWLRYRRHVRLWLPRWRPAVGVPATLYVASSCDPCSSVGAFIRRRTPTGIVVEAAESSAEPMRRITYRSGQHDATGIAAIGRSLEHVNLAWAAVSWVARLPAIQQVLQLVTDAVGGGPRNLGPATARDDEPTGAVEA